MGAAGLRSGILRSPSGRSNGAEETGREGWTDGLTGLSRDGSLARIAVRRSRQRMLPGIEAPAQSLAGAAKRNPDNVCASSRNGCLPAARKALRAGAKKVSMALSSRAAQKRLDTFAGGGLQCLEEQRPGITKAKPYRGAEGRDSSDGACGGRGVTARSDPAAELPKAAGCPHRTVAECG